MYIRCRVYLTQKTPKLPYTEDSQLTGFYMMAT